MTAGIHSSKPEAPPPGRFRRLLVRALRLRCPACGRGVLYGSLVRMRPQCGHCGLRFEREPGYFLGAIYINYGVTALILTAAYLLLEVLLPWPWHWRVAPLIAFALIFPVWFHRYACSLWLGLDHYCDPPTKDESASASEAAPEP